MPIPKSTITVNGRSRATPEYDRFQKMRQRCLNPRDRWYPDYGGRGIRICQGWSTFERFYNDVGQRPDASYSLDRTDNNGHYSCGYCEECIANNWPKNWRWATKKQQSDNRRCNVLITMNGETLTLSDWARRLNVSYGTLSSRRSRGMQGADLLNPVKQRRAFSRKARQSVS